MAIKTTASKDPHTAPAIAADLSPGVLSLSVYGVHQTMGELVMKT